MSLPEKMNLEHLPCSLMLVLEDLGSSSLILSLQHPLCLTGRALSMKTGPPSPQLMGKELFSPGDTPLALISKSTGSIAQMKNFPLTISRQSTQEKQKISGGLVLGYLFATACSSLIAAISSRKMEMLNISPLSLKKRTILLLLG